MMYSAYKLNKQDDNIQPWHIQNINVVSIILAQINIYNILATHKNVHFQLNGTINTCILRLYHIGSLNDVFFFFNVEFDSSV